MKIKSMNWINMSLAIICIWFLLWLYLVIIIPAVLNMVDILLSLVELYKLLEMTDVFFGSAFFLVVSWVILNAIINVTIVIFRFVVKLKLYKEDKMAEGVK